MGVDCIEQHTAILGIMVMTEIMDTPILLSPVFDYHQHVFERHFGQLT